MRVAMELTALELDRGGTARAIDHLLPQLNAREGLELVEFRHEGKVPTSRLGTIVRGLRRELIYIPRTLPRLVDQAGVDLLHCPSPLAPPRCSVPMVITIYDAIGWDHPEWISRGNALQLRTRLPRALATGAHVITSSQYSKQRIAEKVGIDEDRISVVKPGLDARFTVGSVADERSLPSGVTPGQPFVLTVGTLQVRKNVEAAIAAFEQLGPEAENHRLLVVGARGWDDEALLARIKRSPAADRVDLLGRVTDDELVALYRAADAFVFPSLYEGFGYPPLEAMACGTPVISSDRTSLAEIVGDGGMLVDPADIDAITSALTRVLGSDEIRVQLIERGLAHAATYTWERCVDDTLAVYESICR